jgi:hypothetical protein
MDEHRWSMLPLVISAKGEVEAGKEESEQSTANPVEPPRSQGILPFHTTWTRSFSRQAGLHRIFVDAADCNSMLNHSFAVEF